MNKNNWDDIKFVLAVADEGSLNATARRLGVTHATVMRRVAAFEQRNGHPVFQKSLSGYSVLPEAETILRAARNVEDAVLSVDRAVQGTDRSLSGIVRVASTDSICQILLPRIVRTINQTYPELSISLLSANTHHDLSRLAADVAIRPSKKLEDGLEGVFAGNLSFGIYSTNENLSNWIGLLGRLKRSAPAQWMSDNVSKQNVVYEADSFLVAHELVRQGLGNGFLPNFIGAADDDIQRVQKETVTLSVPVWSVLQEDVSRNSRFQLVQNLIATELKKLL